jgi:hypothetical protein
LDPTTNRFSCSSDVTDKECWGKCCRDARSRCSSEGPNCTAKVAQLSAIFINVGFDFADTTNGLNASPRISRSDNGKTTACEFVPLNPKELIPQGLDPRVGKDTTWGGGGEMIKNKTSQLFSPNLQRKNRASRFKRCWTDERIERMEVQDLPDHGSAVQDMKQSCQACS